MGRKITLDLDTVLDLIDAKVDNRRLTIGSSNCPYAYYSDIEQQKEDCGDYGCGKCEDRFFTEYHKKVLVQVLGKDRIKQLVKEGVTNDVLRRIVCEA